jgi:hypothetical protein
LSFLSSSIVSSQPSISFDLSTGSSMSYTSTKLSSQTSWLVRPSYTSRQSPQTTTVLTVTSIKMPGIYFLWLVIKYCRCSMGCP